MQQDFDPRDLEPALTSQEAGGGRGKLIPAVVAVVALVGFGGIVWYAYDKGSEQVAGEAAPLIKADATPIKTKPDDPGGLSVPNRDSLLLNQGSTDAPRVERILPAPEQPLAVPQPVEPLTQQASNAALPSITGARPSSPAAGPVPPVAAAAPPVQTSVPSPQTVAAVPAKPPVAASQPAPQPVALTPPKPAAPPTPAPVAPKPAAVTAPAPAIATGPITGAKIQLGSVRTEAAAASEWAKLQRAHPELGSLKMQANKVEIAGKGTFYRVQVGPLADRSAASQLCGTLKAKNQDCIVVR